MLHRCELFTGKKRGLAVGLTRKGKGTKWVVVVDGYGIPIGLLLESATPGEGTLCERALATVRVPRHARGRPRTKPKRLIADRAYDSLTLRKRLKRRGIDLIAPHLRTRRYTRCQDGRKLRRYKRRWKVERTFAWLGNSRRLVVRWEAYVKIYGAFMRLAFILLCLKRLARAGCL
jgi:transposase